MSEGLQGGPRCSTQEMTAREASSGLRFPELVRDADALVGQYKDRGP